MTLQTIAPPVTVAICAYNAAGSIARTLRSVAAQTVDHHEVLVIDDGSSDETADIVAAAAASDPRIKLVRQSNRGVAATRNRAMGLARAPTVAFLDADDCWTPEHLSIHMAMLEDEGVSVAFGAACFVDPQGADTGDVSRTRAGPISAWQAFCGNPCTTCSTMVLRRSAFDAIGPFRAGLDHAEDQEWILRGVLMGHAFVCSGQRTTFYATSTNGQSADLQRMHNGFEAVRQTARELDPAFARKWGHRAEARICLYLARRALRLGRGRRDALPFLLRAAACWPNPLDLELVSTALAVAWPGDLQALSAFRNRLRAIQERGLP